VAQAVVLMHRRELATVRVGARTALSGERASALLPQPFSVSRSEMLLMQ
jgi:hypothetical protein